MDKSILSLQHQHNKKGSITKYIFMTIALIALIWFVLFIIPIKKKDKHPIFERDLPLVMAHQGGADLAPSNTLAAFHHAVELGVDMIELDIHQTKDGELVVIHDDTIDRTTNGEGKVNELTLAEIQSYDAGYYFKDLEGSYSYRGEGVVVPTLEEVFKAMPQDMRYTIEIKDTNHPDLYETIGEKLWQLMTQYNVETNVVIGSFDQNILRMMTDMTDGEAIVSAGEQEVRKFVILHKLGLHALYKTQADSVEMPTKASGINLMDEKLIHAAQTRGIDVHYWTINDRETMKQLIDLGVDGIITDRPDIMIELLAEYE